MSKQRPGLSGDPTRRFYPRGQKAEAVRFLANTARRYLADKAGDRDLDEAISLYRDAVQLEAQQQEHARRAKEAGR